MIRRAFLIILAAVLMISCCASAETAANKLPELRFVENDRLNYKPILTGNRPELEVDTWLQALVMEDEDEFMAEAGTGPDFTVEQVSGDHLDWVIDDENVLRMAGTLDHVGKVDYLVTAKWCGQTAQTHVYVEFFKCDMPTSIGFKQKNTLKVGDVLELEANYDDGKWPYRDWRGVYPDEWGDVLYDGGVEVVSMETVAFDDPNAGTKTVITALAPGKVVIPVTANQNGLNWKMKVTVDVELPSSWTDEDGNKYTIKNGKATFKKVGKKVKKLNIPKAITVGAKSAKVTEIAASACSESTKLTSVTVGANVAKIGKKAFYLCGKLTKIVLKTKKLAKGDVGAKAFEGMSSKGAIVCPSGVFKAYKKWLKKMVPDGVTITK